MKINCALLHNMNETRIDTTSSECCSPFQKYTKRTKLYNDIPDGIKDKSRKACYNQIRKHKRLMEIE